MTSPTLLFLLLFVPLDLAPDEARAGRAWKEVVRVDLDASRVTKMATGTVLGGLVLCEIGASRLGVFLACPDGVVSDPKDLRAVFFDKDGKRHEGMGSFGGGGSGERRTLAYLFETPDACARTAVRAVAFEQFLKVPGEDLAVLQKAEAFRLAPDAAVSPLPIPLVGKPYLFRLTDVTAKRSRRTLGRGR